MQVVVKFRYLPMYNFWLYNTLYIYHLSGNIIIGRKQQAIVVLKLFQASDSYAWVEDHCTYTTAD